MVSTFPKDIMDSMKGCILSIFWPKKDIVDFFQKSGCTQRELMPDIILCSFGRFLETIKNYSALIKAVEDYILSGFRKFQKL